MFPMERRYYPISELRVDQGEGGAPVIEWYAAVFDSLSEDLGGFRERIGRRAFSKTLQEHDIRGLFNHDPNYVLGRNKAGTLALHVDTRGLQAKATPPDTQWARDLIMSIERGDVSGGSFGFQIIRDRVLEEDDLLVREVLEVRLFDVSIVTYPAYPATEGVALRSVLRDLDIDDLVHPLLRARAGAPLTPEERGRYWAAVETLQRAIPEPEPVEAAAATGNHLVALGLRRRRLQLLERGG